jgi:hypothetical protein
MVAWTVVLVLTFFLPLRVVTVSVADTVIKLGPAAKLLLGVPDSTPAEDRCSPFGRVTFFFLQGGQGMPLMSVLSLTRNTEVR